MLIRYLIRNPLKELYWIDNAGTSNPAFTAYPIKAIKFKTEQEAVDALGKLPEGVYLIDKLYVIPKT